MGSEYQFNVFELNFFAFDCETKPLFDLYTLEPKIQCKPRTAREKYIPPKNAKVRRNWNFNSSIFKTFRKDTDLFLENCFESDFALGRFTGFIKDKKDFKKTKELLKQNYRRIKQVFKQFSSLSGVLPD